MRQWMYRLLLCIVLLAQSAWAVPNLPMIVSGSVYINGAPAPFGTAIGAVIGGEVKGNTTVSQSGVYGMTVEYGQGLVDFYVDDAKAQSINWSIEPQVLNLTVTLNQTASVALATPAPPEPGQTQLAGTTAPTTTTQTATLPEGITANATTAISKGQTTVSPQINPGKLDGVRSPGFEAPVVVLAVLLVSKVTITRRKR